MKEVKLPACPPDFEQFWRLTLAELIGEKENIQRNNETLLEDGLSYASVRFRSFESCEIEGYQCFWQDKPRPLIIYTNGYNGEYIERQNWAKRGVNVFGFDTRGFGRSKASLSLSNYGHILTGIEDRSTSILRGAVCDYIQAVRVAKSLLKHEPTRVIFYGFSFAGAMAIQSAAISQLADVVVAGVPTFGWQEQRHALPILGSAQEVNKYLECYPEKYESVMSVLNYFDTLHFAERLNCPTLIGVGEKDDVVPSETVMAIIDRLNCHHDYRVFRESHGPRDDVIWAPFIKQLIDISVIGEL